MELQQQNTVKHPNVKPKRRLAYSEKAGVENLVASIRIFYKLHAIWHRAKDVNLGFNLFDQGAGVTHTQNTIWLYF